jgi:hypothetical protein
MSCNIPDIVACKLFLVTLFRICSAIFYRIVLVAEDYKDLTRSTEREQLKVTCENWGKFLDTFGPLEQGLVIFHKVSIRLLQSCDVNLLHWYTDGRVV